MTIKVQDFYEKATSTLTYLVYDEVSKDAVIIDPVLDYEPQGSSVSNESATELIKEIEDKDLTVHYIIETHAHADHLTSAQILKEKFPQAKTAIHENIKLVQEAFKGVFNFGDDFDTKGEVFDVLLKDKEKVEAGSLKIEVVHTPGHTPACISLVVNNEMVFTGDAILMPDFGTGRCDFPKGSAEDLYDSISTKLYTLPDTMPVYVGHDYQPGGRQIEFKTTIGALKKENIHLKDSTSKEEFVTFREARDKTLMAPKLLLASIQVNAQNGKFQKVEDNGLSYLKIPVKNTMQ